MSEMVPNKIDFLHLGGGINQGVPFTHLQKHEFEEIENLVGYGSELKYRLGVEALSNSPFLEVPTTVFPYKLSNGTWIMLVAGQTRVGKLDSGSLVAIPISDRASGYAIDDRPWVFEQYKDVWYAVRRNNGRMKRGTQDAMFDAGIEAPTVAPSLVDGGAGALAAGSFYGVYTYYNTETDNESNPSPASTVLTLGANRMIDWSGIGISTNPQVNARRLYRTTAQPTANDPRVYYFMGTILDNTSTVFNDDNVISEDLGDSVKAAQDVPPDACFLLASWKERAWLSDGSTVFFSSFGRFENFKSTQAILVYPDDGHEVRALHAYGQRLIVAKTRGIHYVIGSDETNFSLDTLSDKHGCYSHHSMKSAEGLLFWYGGDNFYRSDGSSVQSISTFKIREILDAIPDNRKEYVSAAIYPTLSWYVVNIPSADGFSKTLVYDYKADAWFPWVHASPAAAPNFVASVYDAAYGQKLYGSFAGNQHLWDLQTGYRDNGSIYTSSWKSAGIGEDTMGFLRAMKLVLLQTTRAAATITLKAYADGASTPVLTRSGLSLDQEREWKAFRLFPIGNLGANWQVGMEYAGGKAMTFRAMSVETGTLRRKVGFAS